MNTKLLSYKNYWYIAFFWLIGVVCGIVFVSQFNFTLVPDESIDIHASLGGILLPSILSICLVVLFSNIGLKYFNFAILFVDGLLFGFCSLYLCRTLEHRVLFIHNFYMLSQCCRSTLLVAFCSCTLCSKVLWNQRLIIAFIFASLLIGFLDYFIYLNL